MDQNYVDISNTENHEKAKFHSQNYLGYSKRRQNTNLK